MPVRAGHHDRGHLAVAGDHGHQAIVQLAFACDHRIIAQIAEQIVHPSAEQDVGVEHARRLFVGDRKRALQTCVRLPHGAAPGEPAASGQHQKRQQN